MTRLLSAYFIWILVLVCLLVRFPNEITAFEGTKRQPPFTVYDGTLYANKPNLARFGIQPIRIIGNQFWHNGRPNEVLPSKQKVQEIAHQFAGSAQPIVLDIEHWRLQGPTSIVEANLEKYLTILEWFRETEPQAVLGYYGTVPIRDYWRAIKDKRRTEWFNENDRLRHLAATVDVFFPSLYTFYNDQEGWKKYAIAQISEARRYGTGKPVIVFLWPEFHDSNRWLKGTYLPANFWKLQLETAKEYADGIVIWGGWGQSNKPAPWDKTAPWWKVTQEFLRGLQNH